MNIVCYLYHRCGGTLFLLFAKLFDLASRHEDAVETALSIVPLKSTPIYVSKERMTFYLLHAVVTKALSRDPA